MLLARLGGVARFGRTMIGAVRQGAALAVAACLAAAGAGAVQAKDPDPVHGVVGALDAARSELIGWMEQNRTRQGNFSVVPDNDPAVAARVRALHAVGDTPHTYYRNLSGFFQGNWSVAELPRESGSTAASVARWNATEERGDFFWAADDVALELQLTQLVVPRTNVSQIWGAAALSSQTVRRGAPATTDMDVIGITAHGSGRVFLVGVPQTSAELLDMRGVFAMLPLGDRQLVNDTYTAVLQDLDEKIARMRALQRRRGKLAPVSAVGQTATNCSMHLYGQLTPVGHPSMQAEMDLVEREMEHPTGIVTRFPPPLRMQLIGYSRRCALALDTGVLDGIPITRFWEDTRYYVAGMFCILLWQLLLMSRQNEVTQTPTAISRLSGLTFFLQTMFDAHVCLAHLIVGMSLQNRISLSMFAVAFLAGTLFIVYEYRLVVLIFRAHVAASPPPPPGVAPHAEPQDARDARDRDDEHVAGAPAEPWHARAVALRDSVAETVREMPRVSLSLGVTLAVFSLSIIAPMILAAALIPMLFSYWVPQIVLSARQRTVGLQPSTVIGMTVTRFFIPLYLFQYPHNLLFFRPTRVVWIPIAWLTLQMLVLLGQYAFGPVFFLPPAWQQRDKAWIWHPTPAQLAVMLQQAPGAPDVETSDAADVQLGDCPVCLMPNDWSDGVAAASTSQARGAFSERQHLLSEDDARATYQTNPTQAGARPWRPRLVDALFGWRAQKRNRSGVMVTPCLHIFHTECLEPWMDIKSICPSCRLPLPSYGAGA
ncbi:hypothetical protein MSPP1_002722 [Malassezia sp. CBS 17886]|nr:hypothetical protein MSPP1_002722 [Malassezia sp. CBS 17886]